MSPHTAARLLLTPLALLLAAPGARAGKPRLDAWGDPLPQGALFRTGSLRDHHDATGPIRFSPDGRTLAGVGPFATVRLWDARTGRDIRTFRGHEGQVHCLAFSADGKTLVCGQGKVVRLWDVASGKDLGRFAGHKNEVDRVALGPGGTWLASCDCWDIRFWDLKTARQTRRIPSGSDGMVSMTLSPDGKRVAVESHDGPLRVWDTATGKPLNSFRGTRSRHEYPQVMPSDRTLLTTHVGGGVSLWDVSTGKRLLRIRKADSPIAVSPDGKTLAAGEDRLIGECPIGLWDLSTGREVRQFRGHQGGVSSLAFSPDGRTLVSVGGDHTLRRWDPQSGKELSRPAGHQNAVAAVAFSPDGRSLASGSADGTVRLWDPLTGREVKRLAAEHEDVRGIAFMGGGDLLLSGNQVLPPSLQGANTEDRALTRFRVWDAATGRERRHFDIRKEFIGCMDFSPVTETVAFGGARKVRLLDVRSGKGLWAAGEGHTEVAAVSFSPDGRLLAGGSGSGIGQATFSLWDTATGKERWRRGWDFESFTAVAFSPDGKAVATGGDGVRLWETATGQKLAEFRDGRSGVAFSPDGRTLATGGRGNAVLLWEVATRQPRRRFAGHDVFCLAFSPDGRLLATGGQDTLVMGWDVTGRLMTKGAGQVPPEKLWARLASADAGAAYDAMCELLAVPDQAVAFLKGRLPVVPEADRKQIGRLIADLDDDQFAVRDKATKELEALGVAAESDLRRCLAGKPSLELRKRADELLRKIGDPGDPAEDAGLRRSLRLVEVLEHIGTAGAKDALRQIAERGRVGRVRQEAAASLGRLEKRRGR